MSDRLTVKVNNIDRNLILIIFTNIFLSSTNTKIPLNKEEFSFDIIIQKKI